VYQAIENVNQGEGYYCFAIPTEDFVEISRLDVAEIRLVFQNLQTAVGDHHPIDLSTYKTIDELPSTMIFNWDLLSTSMINVMSPEEHAMMDRNTTAVPAPILFNALNQRSFQPTDSFSVCVHLAGPDLNPEELQILLYGGMQITPSRTQSIGQVAKDFAKHAQFATRNVASNVIADISGAQLLDNVPGERFGEYVKFEFDTKSLLLTLIKYSQDSSLFNLPDLSSDDVSKLLDPENMEVNVQEVREIVSRSIGTVQLFCSVETADGNSVAEFLIAGVKSNIMFFDNACQFLKKRENLNDDAMIKWSNRALFSTQVSQKEILPAEFSVISDSKMTGNALPPDTISFKVKIDLPNFSTISPPEDLRLFVHNSDRSLAFEDEDAEDQSKFLTTPVVKRNGTTVAFKWTMMSLRSETFDSSLKLAVFGKSGRDLMKIGRTVSTVTRIGKTANKHIINLRLMHASETGLVELTTMEGLVVGFLEALSLLVYTFADLTVFSEAQFSEGANLFSEDFHKIFMEHGNSLEDFVTVIDQSQYFTLNNSEQASILKNILNYIGDTSQVVDKLAHALVYGDKNFSPSELVVLKMNIESVFKLNVTELEEKFQTVPSEAATFVLNTVNLHREIKLQTDSTTIKDASNAIISADSVESKPQTESSMPKSTDESIQERSSILSSLISQLPGIQPKTTLLEAMDTNLNDILLGAQENIVSTTNLIDSIQSIIEGLVGPLLNLLGFCDDFNSLVTSADRLNTGIKAINNFVVNVIGRAPIPPLKAFINIIKKPLNTLNTVMKSSVESMEIISNQITSNLRPVIRQSDKIEECVENLERPRNEIERLSTIIDFVMLVAELGFLSNDTIAQFLNGRTIEEFFDTIKNSVDGIQSHIQTLSDCTAGFQPFFQSVNALYERIQRSISDLSPIFSLFNKMDSFIQQVIWVYENTVGWLIDLAMIPINAAIELFLLPFRGLIRDMVNALNPFNIPFVEDVLALVNNFPLISVVNGFIAEITSMIDPSFIENLLDPVMIAAATIGRTVFGLVDSTLIQIAGNVSQLEQILGASDSMEFINSMLQEKQQESLDYTLSDVIFDIKAKTLDPLSVKCDVFLRRNQNLYEDLNDTENLLEQLDHSSNYEMIPCHINPVEAVQNHAFKHSKLDWVTASLAGILHQSIILDQVEKLKLGASAESSLVSYIPMCIIVMH